MNTPQLADAVWRKSTRSGGNESSCVEVTSWRTSSYTGKPEGDCVEVGPAAELIAVRDSKDTTGPVLSFGRAEWRGLLTRIKSGGHDLA